MNPLNHLLESTLFALAAGLATLALRKTRARARHWLWLAASLKFLVPFSLLVGLGSQVQQRTAPPGPPQRLTIVMEDPAAPPVVIAPSSPVPQNPWPEILLAIWACGTLAVFARWAVRWSRAADIVRSGEAIGKLAGIPVLASPSAMEPAAFGIVRARLLLPSGLASRLSEEELSAVLAHELCHVRHRDNLAAALHMLVEALFWFYPPVWWIGARMVDERERACDEEVVLGGSDPEVYASGILAVCRICLESPMPCVSAISGADLQKRIETILTPRAIRNLTIPAKLLLGGIAAAAISLPVAIGLSHAQERTVTPLAFEVASVKVLPEPRGLPDGYSMAPRISGGRIDWVTGTRPFVQYAYHVQRWQTVYPSALQNSFYRIDAKMDESATRDQVRLMFQTLLRERFHLVAHREAREASGYSLAVAKNGLKLKPYQDSDEPPPQPDYFLPRPPELFAGRVIISKEGELSALTGRRVTMTQLAEGLQDEVQTFVLDQTGLTGKYFFGTKFVKSDNPRDVDGPSLFAALQEAMGLRLEKTRGPVEMLVVDHIDAVPTANQ